MPQNNRKKIVVIGGGTGTFTVLSGLKKYPLKLSAIVSMADDGGSTKILREEFGVLPPGSVRPALVALAKNSEKTLADLFNFRFQKGCLKDHNFGNLLITALSTMYGDFEKAIQKAAKILNVKGEVIPATLDDARLYAVLENGQKIVGETNIDIPKHDGRLRIEKVYLQPPCRANRRALRAINRANLITIGPGDLFSSIIPNLLVKGIPEAVRKSRAKKVYICNLMNKFGETYNFTVLDFVKTIEKYLGENVIDYVILNKKKPSFQRIAKYERERASFVEYQKSDFKGRNFKIIEDNFLRLRGFIRHHPDKLAETIVKIIKL